jgi:hypothetical protein
MASEKGGNTPDFAQQQNSQLVKATQSDWAGLQPAHVQNPEQVLGNQSMLRLLQSGGIQAKLTVNQPGDKYEQEAD